MAGNLNLGTLFAGLKFVVDKPSVRQVQGAIKSATTNAGKLSTALTEAGNSARSIGQKVVRPLNEFKNALSKGAVSAKQFNAAITQLKGKMDPLTASLRKTTAAVKNQAASAKKGKEATKRMSVTMQDLTSASILAVGPLSGVGARIAATTSIITRANIKIAAMVIGVTGLGVVLAKLASSAVRSSLAMERIIGRLRVSTGSAAGAAVEFEFIAKVSEQMGLNVQAAALEYSKFAAAARTAEFSSENTRKVFIGLSTAAAAMRLSTEQVRGAFKALEQMLSKGTVQAEELRGQLAERIPGAFGLAARAIGVTTIELGKMLKKGVVLAKDLLPKLADQMIKVFGTEAQKAAHTLSAEINRVASNWFKFGVAMDKTLGVSTLTASIMRTLSNSIKFVTKNISTLAAVLVGATAAMLGLFSAQLLNIITAAVGLIGRLIARVIGLTAAVNVLTTTTVIGFLLKLGLALTAGIAAFVATKAALEETVKSYDEVSKSLRKQIELVKELAVVSKPAAEATRAEVLGQIIANTVLIQQLKRRIAIAKTKLAFTGPGKATTEQTKRATKALAIWGQQVVQAEIKNERLRSGLNEFNEAVGKVTRGQERLKSSLKEAGSAMVTLTKRFKDGKISGAQFLEQLLKLRAVGREVRLTVAEYIKLAEAIEKVLEAGAKDTQAALLSGARETARFIASELVKRLKGEKDVRNALIAGAKETTAFLAVENAKRIQGEKDTRDALIAGAKEKTKFDITEALKRVQGEEDVRNALKRGAIETQIFEAELAATRKRQADDAARGFRMIAAAQAELRAEMKAGAELASEIGPPLEEVLEFNRAMEKAAVSVEQGWERATVTAENFNNVIASGLANAIVNANNFGEALKNIVKQLAVMILRAEIFNFLMGIGGGGGGNNIIPFVQTTAAAGGGIGHMAHGGPVTGGQATLIGEKGPEIFVPGSSGNIIPNHKLGMGGITINIDARGAGPGVEAEISRALEAVEERAVTRSIRLITGERMRGGAF